MHMDAGTSEILRYSLGVNKILLPTKPHTHSVERQSNTAHSANPYQQQRNPTLCLLHHLLLHSTAMVQSSTFWVVFLDSWIILSTSSLPSCSIRTKSWVERVQRMKINSTPVSYSSKLPDFAEDSTLWNVSFIVSCHFQPLNTKCFIKWLKVVEVLETKFS